MLNLRLKSACFSEMGLRTVEQSTSRKKTLITFFKVAFETQGSVSVYTIFNFLSDILTYFIKSHDGEIWQFKSFITNFMGKTLLHYRRT